MGLSYGNLIGMATHGAPFAVLGLRFLGGSYVMGEFVMQCAVWGGVL